MDWHVIADTVNEIRRQAVIAQSQDVRIRQSLAMFTGLKSRER